MRHILSSLVVLLLLQLLNHAAADDSAIAREKALLQSYGVYAGMPRTPEGDADLPRLINELGELHANTYNWLIAHTANDWNDLQKFLPLAHKHGIRVWVTLLPPSESPPHSQRFSEPFRLDFEKWVAELAALSLQEPALVAWSIDDFTDNLGFFTPEKMQQVIAIQREKNPQFAFVPCVYYKQATSSFAEKYRKFLDGILFPYRSESTKAGLQDASQVAPEVKTLKKRFGRNFPIVVDIYATAHSRLGASSVEYVEQVMKLAFPVADGVHIYTHQNKRDPQKRAKYDAIQSIMKTWD